MVFFKGIFDLRAHLDIIEHMVEQRRHVPTLICVALNPAIA